MKITEIIKNKELLLNHSNQWVSFVNNEIKFSKSKVEGCISVESFKILIEDNKSLFEGYFDGQNYNILAGMISYNLENKRICPIENLDIFIKEKIVYLKDIELILDKINELSRRYTIYMKRPWEKNSEVALLYRNYEENMEELEKKVPEYEYFLEIFIIKDELLPLYTEHLKLNNKYNYHNLLDMIIYYAENDAHMDIEKIDHKDKGFHHTKGNNPI